MADGCDGVLCLLLGMWREERGLPAAGGSLTVTAPAAFAGLQRSEAAAAPPRRRPPPPTAGGGEHESCSNTKSVIV